MVRWHRACSGDPGKDRTYDECLRTEPPRRRHLDLSGIDFLPDPRQGRLRAAGGASECHADYALIWNKNHTLSHVAEEFIKYVESIEERNSVE